MVLSEKRELFEKLLEQIQLEEVEKNHPLISAGEMELEEREAIFASSPFFISRSIINLNNFL